MQVCGVDKRSEQAGWSLLGCASVGPACTSQPFIPLPPSPATMPTSPAAALEPADGLRPAAAHAASLPLCRHVSKLARVTLASNRTLQTARDLLQRTLLELVELLDLPVSTVKRILAEVAAKVAPPPRTVSPFQCATGVAGQHGQAHFSGGGGQGGAAAAHGEYS